MLHSPRAEPRLVESVLHPTDFSDASRNAFAHALAIALMRRTKFTLLHVGRGKTEWNEFPSVRGTLQRWGLLDHDSPRSAVFEELQVGVNKVAMVGSDPVDGIVGFAEQHQTDLIVLATRGAEGLPRWMRRSVSEPVARKARTMTLFVPAGSNGFVSEADGSFSLQRILIPIDHSPGPEAAIAIATRAAEALGSGPVEITLLHIGGDGAPEPHLPEDPAWTWNHETREGKVVEGILESAEAAAADLIVMVTAGREGILDALRGSTTEQVLRQTPCPVLTVPADRTD